MTLITEKSSILSDPSTALSTFYTSSAFRESTHFTALQTFRVGRRLPKTCKNFAEYATRALEKLPTSISNLITVFMLTYSPIYNFDNLVIYLVCVPERIKVG